MLYQLLKLLKLIALKFTQTMCDKLLNYIRNKMRQLKSKTAWISIPPEEEQEKEDKYSNIDLLFIPQVLIIRKVILGS